MNIIKQGMLWGVLVVASLTASAQSGNPPPQDGPPPGPPPEAIAACKDKADGAKVEFTGHRGDKLTGVCRKMGEVLAAMPEGGPPPR